MDVSNRIYERLLVARVDGRIVAYVVNSYGNVRVEVDKRRGEHGAVTRSRALRVLRDTLGGEWAIRSHLGNIPGESDYSRAQFSAVRLARGN